MSISLDSCVQAKINHSKTYKQYVDRQKRQSLAEKRSEQIISCVVQKAIQEAKDITHNSSSSCSICLEPIKESTECKVASCLHIFHTECLTRWFWQNPSCPMCRNPIHEAPLLEFIKEQINSKQDLNAATYGKNGNHTLLEIAIRENQIEGIRLLIAAKANLNLQNETGATPLHLAVTKNDATIARMIIDAKPDLNIKDNKGVTALHVAATKKEDHGILKMLIEAKAEMNVNNKEGSTPLHWAVSFGSIESMDLLINAGADIEAKDNFHRTPLHMAVIHKNAVQIQRLFEAKANFNALDKNLYTPLHVAARLGMPTSIVQFLLNAGSLQTLRNKQGETPSDVALSKRHFALVEFLAQG